MSKLRFLHVKQVKRELPESVERFRPLIPNASDLITVLAPDGTVRYASPASERALGYAPEELVNTNVFAYVHTEDEADVKVALTQALQTPGIVHPLECRFRHRDGSWRKLEALSTGSCDAGGEAGIVVNARDVSEREIQTALLRYQTLHGAGTDLPNRALFHDSLQRAIVDACRR